MYITIIMVIDITIVVVIHATMIMFIYTTGSKRDSGYTCKLYVLRLTE